MSTTNNTTPAIQVEALTNVFKEVPAIKEITSKMEKANAACLAILESLTAPEDDSDYEYNNGELAKIKDQYNKMLALRKPITEQTDEFKEYMMQFERPFNPAATKSNPYLEKRKWQEDYQQRKIEAKQKAEVEAALKKELENYKVDLRAKMLENLSTMIANSTKRVDAGSKDWFDKATLDNFDTKAEAYKSNKPKLKQADYDACFIITQIPEPIVAAADLGTFVEDIKKDETFDKWNAKLIETISPILNEWRARIPDLKKQKQDLAEALKKSADEATKLQEEQKKQNDLAFATRQTQIDKQAEEQKSQIQEQANVDKLGNELSAQAATQNMESGATQLVLKFKDPKTTPKALFALMFHVLSSPAFTGIQKQEAKTKKLVVDDRGRPVYIDAVQFWIDFYLKYCNADVENVIIYEDAKITVRK